MLNGICTKFFKAALLSEQRLEAIPISINGELGTSNMAIHIMEYYVPLRGGERERETRGRGF